MLSSQLCKIISEGQQPIPCASKRIAPAREELSEVAGDYSTVSIRQEVSLGTSLPFFNASLAPASSFFEYNFVLFLS